MRQPIATSRVERAEASRSSRRSTEVPTDDPVPFFTICQALFQNLPVRPPEQLLHHRTSVPDSSTVFFGFGVARVASPAFGGASGAVAVRSGSVESGAAGSAFDCARCVRTDVVARAFPLDERCTVVQGGQLCVGFSFLRYHKASLCGSLDLSFL